MGKLLIKVLLFVHKTSGIKIAITVPNLKKQTNYWLKKIVCSKLKQKVKGLSCKEVFREFFLKDIRNLKLNCSKIVLMNAF